MSSTVFVLLGAVAVAGGAGAFGLWLVRGRSRPGLPLAGTVLLAFGVLAVVTGWVLAEGINRGEALRTGGLAAGSVVALYALWLNDRRRRVDEQRQELDSQRAEHDRERAADERFARAVELLGNEADQVRVGALHALAGLARNRRGYTQTVLDVLCSYLRRPFDHPRYAQIRGEVWKGDELQAERERQVRRTAQWLITDLLPAVSEQDAPHYDLDLHGAALEYFDISGKVIGQLRARVTNLYESNTFKDAQVHGLAWFTGAHSWGRFNASDIVFRDRSWFTRFEAHKAADFTRADFGGEATFTDATFHGPVSFEGAMGYVARQ